MKLSILKFNFKMAQIDDNISKLEVKLEKLLEPQQQILEKISKYEKLLNIEKIKLKEEQDKVEKEVNLLSEELITLGWIGCLLLNHNDKHTILLNDKCLGNKQKFFEALRVLLISEINTPKKSTIQTGIGLYLDQIREKYIIDTCYLKVSYKTNYFCIADKDDEHEFNPDPERISVYKKDKEIECDWTNINFDEILNYYSEVDTKFISGDGDSDGIWNELNLKLRCWCFTLKE